jgi:excisionase family DNA binding protein
VSTSTPTTPAKLLTVRETAERLGVSADTIYVWSSKGTLDRAKIKLGKRLRFNSEMIDQIVREGFT